MRKLVFLLFLAAAVCCGNVLCAAENPSVSSADGTEKKTVQGGKVIWDFYPEDEQEFRETNVLDQANIIVSVGRYFHEKYPGNKINEDISEDVMRLFPELEGQEIADRAMLIRDGVRFYRFFSEKYEEIKEKMLMPEEPPLILHESAYEKDYTESYIDSPDLVVVPDFSKVVSYSFEPRDFKAYEQKIFMDGRSSMPKDEQKPYERLMELFVKTDWKKFLFYGTLYEDPLTQGGGNGQWAEKDRVKVRLISEYSTVNNSKEIRGAFHFVLPDGTALELLGKNKPEFVISGDNLSGSEVFLPMPRRMTYGKKEVFGQEGNFAVPLVLKVKNPEESLKISARAVFSVCSAEGCRKEVLEPVLSLNAGAGYASTVSNFIVQSFNILPAAEQSGTEAVSLSVFKTESGTEELRLRLDTDASPADIDVMVDDGRFVFQKPRIAVYDDYTDVFLPLADGEDISAGQKLSLFVKLGRHAALKIIETVENLPWTELQEISLTPAILLAAFAGGLLLNFMSGVFPLLMLRLTSVCGFGCANPDNVRRNFFYTVGGIFTGFIILILILFWFRYKGAISEWGMQFQSGWFLSLMIFVLVLFAAYMSGLCLLKTPEWLKRCCVCKKGDGAFRAWFSGGTIMLFSTFCTVPYLSSAVGFALGGTFFEMTVVFLFAVCGLAFPYFLAGLFPTAVVFMPRPGNWMRKVRFVLLCIILLTLLRLCGVFYVQTEFSLFVRLVVYLLLFLFLLAYRRNFERKLFLMRFGQKKETSVRRLLGGISLALCWLLVLFASWDLNRGFSREEKTAVAVVEKEAFVKKGGIDEAKIKALLDEGKSVLLSIDAPWCLSCYYNKYVVLKNPVLQNLFSERNVVVIQVDWSEGNGEVLDFMSRYGRKSVPFYVLFTPAARGGVVLPKILSSTDLRLMTN